MAVPHVTVFPNSSCKSHRFSRFTDRSSFALRASDEFSREEGNEMEIRRYVATSSSVVALFHFNTRKNAGLALSCIFF